MQKKAKKKKKKCAIHSMRQIFSLLLSFVLLARISSVFFLLELFVHIVFTIMLQRLVHRILLQDPYLH